MSRLFMVNLLTALGYFLGGFAGHLLEMPPALGSPVWPAAGIGLACLLRYGTRVFPGLAIGIFLTQLYAFMDSPSLGHGMAAVMLSLLIGLGSLSQAVLGYSLIRHWLGDTGVPADGRKGLAFLILGGPVSCVVAATVGTLSLYYTGMLATHMLMLTWANWWVGDSLGVVLVTPMLLYLMPGKRHYYSAKRRSVVLPMLVVLVIVVLLFRVGFEQIRTRMSAEFQRQVNLLNTTLAEEIDDNVDLARAVKAYFDGSENVTAAEFDIFARSLMRKSRGIFALEWAPRTRVDAGTLDAGSGSGAISPGGIDTEDIPAPGEYEHFIIRYLLPHAGNEKAVGFDIASNPSALATIRVARDTGHIASTPPIQLVQAPDGKPGTVLYAPVYSGRIDWNTVEQRREHLRGIVAMVFRISDSVTALLNEYKGLMLDLRIYNDGNLLYSNAPSVHYQAMNEIGLRTVNRINVGDRQWDLIYVPSETFLQHNMHWAIWWLLLSGFVIAMVLSGGLMVLTGHTMEVEALVRKRTRELEDETQERQRIIDMRDIQNMVLRAIAAPGTMDEILLFIAELAVTDDPNLSCSIQLIDESGRHLYNAASSRLPPFYLSAIQDYPTGRKDASFAAAACMGVQVIVEDISKDPGWEKLGNVAYQTELAAAWSEPIIVGGETIGVLTLYDSKPGRPDEHQLELLQDFSRLSGIAVEQKRSETRIQHLAFYDTLTELPNRRLLIDRLDRELARARRNDTYGAVLFIDLDNFKTLNDSMGHQVGDLLLMQVAYRMKSCVREMDTVARHGGDEFVALLPAEHEDLQKLTERVIALAERMREEMNRGYDLDGYMHHISPSIGITFYSRDSEDPDTVLKQADTAMYSAKARGRNTFSFYHPDMQAMVDKRFNLERDMRVALDENQFIILYQPQYDADFKIIGAEALIRWEHPENGLLSPDDFIPLAEENNLIIRIGEWIIDQVCTRLQDWQELDQVAVNVSPVQLHSDDFVARMRRVLRPHEAVVRRLMLEMTEGIMIENVEQTTATIQSLQNLGIGISIDDFGKGYSSLVYLKNLPLNQLKVDKMFVGDIERDPNARVIVETIIAMARHLQLDIIAEGVETERQLQFLREQGCHKFQGYYFSYPLTAEQFTRLYRENHNLHTGRTMQ